MANKWVEHVRKWSADHGVSYMCATGMPACKEAYQKGKAPKNTQKANREQMGMEDKDVALPKKAKKGITADTLKDKISQIKEAKKMGIEDIKSAMLRRAQGIVQPLQTADTAVVKPKGRPKKYETAEEARRMKSVKTVEARNRRRAEKAKAKEPVVEAPKMPQWQMDNFRRSKEESAREEAKKLKPMDARLFEAFDEYDDYESNHITTGDAGYSYATKNKMRAREKASLAKAWNLPKDWYNEENRNLYDKAVADGVWRGSGYHDLQEVTDDELFRTMVQGGAHAEDNQIDDYSMIINHLVEHISDPSEPVDPRDYDQAIHFIREMRRAKGGAELYSREHSPRYGGAYTPMNSGNEFLDVIANTGHQLGQAHPASKYGLNPFDMGEKLGEKLGHAMMKTKWGNPKTGIFSKSFWTPKKKHH